jgi:vacuolar-type H+-ATPase subunit H
MRIIPFHGRGGASPYESCHAELEAALIGDREGSVADSWRELREDVRALAPPMAPGFEHQLGERIAERAVRRRPRKLSPSEHAGASSVSAPAPSAITTKPAGSNRASRELRQRLGWLRLPSRPAAGGIAAAAGALIAAILIAGPWRSGTSSEVAPQSAGHQTLSSRPGGSVPEAASRTGARPAAPAKASAQKSTSEAATPGRTQQLAASVSLAATPSDVQAIADRVARLAVSDGGFVQSSHVQVQQAGTSEANIMLRLPSAELGAALNSLGQLAPVRAESQSLQDITDAYDAARRRLTDATSERQALLRALSRATTQGQIDSLRERLSQAGSAIAQARSELQAVSQRASTAEVEVTVLGNAHAKSEGLTLHRGLHAAGRVLLVSLVVLLVAAAILAPVALLLAALAAGRSAWRRYQRERVLDAR